MISNGETNPNFVGGPQNPLADFSAQNGDECKKDQTESSGKFVLKREKENCRDRDIERLKSTSNRSTAHFLGNQPKKYSEVIAETEWVDTFPKVEQAGLSNASTTSLTLNGCTLGQAT